MAHDLNTRALTPSLELIDGGRAKRVRRHDDNLASRSALTRGKLADGRRFTSPVHADDEHDTRRSDGRFRRGAFPESCRECHAQRFAQRSDPRRNKRASARTEHLQVDVFVPRIDRYHDRKRIVGGNERRGEGRKREAEAVEGARIVGDRGERRPQMELRAVEKKVMCRDVPMLFRWERELTN
jgi:hypothetical protein